MDDGEFFENVLIPLQNKWATQLYMYEVKCPLNLQRNYYTYSTVYRRVFLFPIVTSHHCCDNDHKNPCRNLKPF